ncbi:hypothetical protein D9615_007855 [Tricholomella constricta]|uniref:Reverse transcriptase domain-containing protein n=1 Tax=Tricholomella constricta TaxID=117010 RepID=A0A8H5M0Z7_9AGAR|nr:hypothetical protein D9615_007855 [Tricholomella constricta]
MALRRSTRATSARPRPAQSAFRDSSPAHEPDTDHPVSLGDESDREPARGDASDSSEDDSGPSDSSGDRRPLQFVPLGRDPAPAPSTSGHAIIPQPNLIPNVTRTKPSAAPGAPTASSSRTAVASAITAPVPSAPAIASSICALPRITLHTAPAPTSPSTRPTPSTAVTNTATASSRLPAFSEEQVHDAHSFVRSVLTGAPAAPASSVPAASSVPVPLPTTGSLAPATSGHALSSRNSPTKRRVRAGKERARSPPLDQSAVDKVEAALRDAVPIARPQLSSDAVRGLHPLPSRPKGHNTSVSVPRPPAHYSRTFQAPSAAPLHAPSRGHRSDAPRPLASPASFTPEGATQRSHARTSFATPHHSVHRSGSVPARPALITPAQSAPRSEHRSGSNAASSRGRSERLLGESELEGILYKYGQQLLRETGVLPRSPGPGPRSTSGAYSGPSGPSGGPYFNRFGDHSGPALPFAFPVQRSFDRFGDRAFNTSDVPPSGPTPGGPPPIPHAEQYRSSFARRDPPNAYFRPPESNLQQDPYFHSGAAYQAPGLYHSRDAAYALDPNEIVIPESVISILRNGWWDYIPLDALTNDACHSAAFGSLKPDDTTLGINDRGHITQRSVMIDSRKEKHMDCSTWKQSSDNLLSALRDHLVIFDHQGRPDRSATGSVIASYEIHFKYLKARGDIETNFPSYILYCIFVRRQWLAHRRTGKPDVPLHIFQIEVFSDIERKRMHKRVDTLTAAASGSSAKPFRISQADSSSSSSRSTADRSASKKGDSSSSKAKSTFPYSSDRPLITDSTSAPGPESPSSKAPTINGATPAATSTAGASTALPVALAAKHASITTPARCAALVSTVLNDALRERFLPVSTPLKHWRWTALLSEAGALEEFAEVPKGLQFGFNLGLEDFLLDHTFSPPNHYKSEVHHKFVEHKYAEEIRLGRVSPGYPPQFISDIFGHYRTAPLNVIERTPGKLRITVDHSFPRGNPLTPSINSCIDSKRFQCAWGTFSDCYLLVADAPPGTEACIFDVDAAFRNIPTSPLDRTATALLINGLVHLDGRLNFGLCAAPGIFGSVADAIVRIFLHKGIEALLKWVDDFVFFRYPRLLSDNQTCVFTYDESLVWSIAEDLGWPWAADKFVPFNSVFTYIGFEWSLRDKTVRLPDAKRAKYLLKLSAWSLGDSVSLLATESLIGTLNHITLVVPEGRSHLPALFKFRASFRDTAPWVKHRITASVFAEISWWSHLLSASACSMRIVRPPPPHNIPIFVDASTSWGIGLFVDGKWLAWRLLPGWKTNGRDIGWAEMVAVDLALRAILASGLRDCHLVMRSDNTGVVGALSAGRSRNSEQNHILRHIVSNFQSNTIWLSTLWVSTKENIADAPSRGHFPSRSTLFPFPPALPDYLKSFVAPSVSFHDLPA